MKNKLDKLFIFLSVLGIAGYLYAAARGTGAFHNKSIGPSDESLYLPAATEERGWLTDTSSSVNKNFVVISSAIADLEVLAGNTNYIQLRTTLQSGATAYVSSFSVDGQTLLARASGNVGINTADPGVRLHVIGDVTSSGILTSSGNVKLGDATGDIVTVAASSFTFMNVSSFSLAGSGLYLVNNGTNRVLFGTDGNVGIASFTPTNLLVVGAGSGVLNVLSGGTVGIGIVTPITPLHVLNTGTGFRNTLRLENDQAAAADVGVDLSFFGVGSTGMSSLRSGWNAGADTNAYLAFDTRTSGGTTEKMRIASTGFLGIGITTPSASLHAVRNGTGSQEVVRVSNDQAPAADVGPNISFYGAGGTGMASIESSWNGAADTNSYLAFDTRTSGGTTEKMRITSAGNIGIGATSPNASIDIGKTDSGGGTPAWSIHGSTGSPGNQGAWLQGTGQDDITIAAGARWDGGSFEATSGSGGASLFIMDGDTTTLYINSGLTNGADFTQTPILTILTKGGSNPVLRLAQSTNCATATPGAVGELCVQNSATTPVWVGTATTVAGFQPITLAAE